MNWLLAPVRWLKSSPNSLSRCVSPGLPQLDHLMVAPARAPPVVPPACPAGWAAPPPPLPHAASVRPARPAPAVLRNLRRLMIVESFLELMEHPPIVY